jgi:hypothetical protein
LQWAFVVCGGEAIRVGLVVVELGLPNLIAGGQESEAICLIEASIHTGSERIAGGDEGGVRGGG